MTNQAQATTASKEKTFFGTTAKETRVLVAAETSLTKLAERLAFVNKRVGVYHTQGKAQKAKRWEAVARIISERMVSLGNSPKANDTAMATFTSAPLPKATKRKAAAKPKASADPIDALLKATGMSVQELLLKLAARV